jgi:hypothetical protein
MAWLAISSVGAAVLILNETPLVVFEVGATTVAADVVSDVAAERGGSEWVNGGPWHGSGSVGRLGIVCRRLQAAGARFEAGAAAVVAIVVVVVVDGSCAAIASGDVFSIGGDEGLGAASSRVVACVGASTVEVEVV